MTYDTELLDVPGQQNTWMNITLKNYAMSRIQEIKLHNMHPTLTFADLFAKARITNTSRDTKQNARNTLVRFFEYLQTMGEIRSYALTKQGNSFQSIQFVY